MVSAADTIEHVAGLDAAFRRLKNAEADAEAAAQDEDEHGNLS